MHMAPRIEDIVKNRWTEIGDREYPEPPTLVAKVCGALGQGELWLGSLPTQHNLEDILGCVGKHGGKFTLQISCFANAPWQNYVVEERWHKGKRVQKRDPATQGVMLPGATWFTVEMSNPKARSRGIRRCRNIILSSLLAGENCYIHCVSGVSRAPVAAAVLAAFLHRESVQAALGRVNMLRQCKMHHQRNMMGRWTEAVASEPPSIFPQFQCFSAAKLVGYRNARVRASGGDGREPICFMKRSGKGRTIQGEILTTVDPAEARQVLAARFCTDCFELLRASVRSELWEAGFDLND